MELPRYRGRFTSRPIFQPSRICIKTEVKIQGVMVLIAFQGKPVQLATLASAFPYFNKRFASRAIIGCTLKKSCSGTQNPGMVGHGSGKNKERRESTSEASCRKTEDS